MPIYILYKAKVLLVIYKLAGCEFKTTGICHIWKNATIWLREIKALYSNIFNFHKHMQMSDDFIEPNHFLWKISKLITVNPNRQEFSKTIFCQISVTLA